MKKKLALVLSLVLCCAMLSGCTTLTALMGKQMANAATDDTSGDTVTLSREEYEKYKQFDKLLELMDIVDEGYFEDYDKQSLLDGAADGLLSGLGDPYTFYYTPEEYAKLWEDDEGEYAGVGIQISTSYLTGICTISRVFDNGPAHEAGVRKGDTVTVIDVTTKNDAPFYGCAIDIGTTTVTGVLMDLASGKLTAKASAGNGQIRYGADVINRIIEQGKPGGRKKLQDAILKETLVPLLQTLCKDAKLPPARIVRLCVASNTTMNHLFVGVDADPVRMEPYIPAFFHWDGLRVHDLGLPAHPDAAIRLAPNIGSYVGGDITAGTFASMLWDRDELSLFIDLGTNGEIVFGNRDFMVSCACSAGPAFEGGDISCGMRATDGAIESCVIDPETMEPTFGIIGEPGQKPVGLCGSGIIDTIAELFHAGILNSKGIFVREGKRVAHDRHGCGRYILATPEESATGREVALNEVDIDNFIRAKGAIYSAIDTLLAAMDMDESVIESFYVAGGIGSGINMRNAVRIGMFPNVPLELFHYIGNSSLAGAYTMALSDEANDRVEQVARNMTYMELSTHPGYMDAFVAACFLPHTDAARFASAE